MNKKHTKKVMTISKKTGLLQCAFICSFLFVSFLYFKMILCGIGQTIHPPINTPLFLWLNERKMSIWKKCEKERLLGLTDWLTDWLTDRLTDRLTDWLTDWLTDLPTDWLTSWLTDRLTHICIIDWPTHRMTDRPTDRPTDRSTDRLTNWLTDWLTDSQADW